MIKDLRNFKSEKGIAPNAPVKLVVTPKEPFKGFGDYLGRFSFAESIQYKETAPEGHPFLYTGYSLSVEEAISKDELKAKLLKEEESLKFEVERSSKMLANPGFVKKAPADKVASEQEKLEKNKALLAEVETRLKTL
jgi:valyl-tRNA synthetase